MSILGFFGKALTLAGAVATFLPGGQLIGLGLVLAGSGLNAIDRPGGTPAAAEQSGTQREMVLDPQAHIPVVYGRAIVAPRLAYVTEKTELVNGEHISKLYFVGVLSEGAPAPAAR